MDGESKKSGSLFEDFEPPFNPPEEIDDPEDKKPSDWVDEVRSASSLTLIKELGTCSLKYLQHIRVLRILAALQANQYIWI